MSLLRRKSKFLLLLIVVLVSCNNKEVESEHYSNGGLKYEVPLQNGLRHGKLTEYFENGNMKGYSNWKKGILDGKSVLYYEDGKMNQENYFNNGLYCCESKFYRKDGSLMEIQYFDERGRMIDYKKVLENGLQNMDEQTRQPIILCELDTINLGGIFECQIRLGNRRFNYIEVILGDKNEPHFLLKPKLPKIDSVTALLKIKADTIGVRSIKGVIFEFNVKKPDSLLRIPFEKKYFVKAPVPRSV